MPDGPADGTLERSRLVTSRQVGNVIQWSGPGIVGWVSYGLAVT